MEKGGFIAEAEVEMGGAVANGRAVAGRGQEGQDGGTMSRVPLEERHGSRVETGTSSAPSCLPAQPELTTNGAKIDVGEDKGNLECFMRCFVGMLIVGPYTQVTRDGSLKDNHLDGRKQDGNTLSATPCASAKGARPIVVKIPVQADREKQGGTASIRAQREAEPGE